MISSEGESMECPKRVKVRQNDLVNEGSNTALIDSIHSMHSRTNHEKSNSLIITEHRVEDFYTVAYSQATTLQIQFSLDIPPSLLARQPYLDSPSPMLAVYKWHPPLTPLQLVTPCLCIFAHPAA